MTSERDQNSNGQIRIESLMEMSMLISHVLLERFGAAQWPFASFSQDIIWSGDRQKMMTQKVQGRPEKWWQRWDGSTRTPKKADFPYRNPSTPHACFAVCLCCSKTLCLRVNRSHVPLDPENRDKKERKTRKWFCPD